MKLFLCGGGSGKQILNALYKFSNLLNKEKPILYIPLAMDEQKYDSCHDWFSNELKLLEIDNFDMVKSSYELSQKNLNEYSSLFIGGGNTYKLLNDLKQNNNLEKIELYLKNDGIIFGGSAGAIIFGKNIDPCLLEDKNNVNLQETCGLNFVNNYSILCHLNNSNFNKNLNYLIEYSKNNKLIYLPENDVLYINNYKTSIIGTSKYAIFKNGKYEFHHFANLKKDMLEN